MTHRAAQRLVFVLTPVTSKVLLSGSRCIEIGYLTAMITRNVAGLTGLRRSAM
jgi:hypothetical protein